MKSHQFEALAAQMRAAPSRVKTASNCASLLGLVAVPRLCAGAYAGEATYVQAILAGCIYFGLLWFNGMSLLRRSRSGFVVLSVVAAYLVYSGVVAVARLLRLPAAGTAGVEAGAILVGLTALSLIVVGGVLFRYLLAAETLRYVCGRPAEQVPVTDPPLEDGSS